MDKKGRLNKKEQTNTRGTVTTSGTTPGKMQAAGEQDSVILAELRRLRQKHTEAANDNKKALARLETNMKELVERTTSLEQQVGHVEERLGDTEDKTARLERMAAFLLHQEAKLAAKCDDLESRRNNIWIHGIPEGSEKKDTIGFITDFIHSSLQIPDDTDIRIERAHRSLIAKPKESDALP